MTFEYIETERLRLRKLTPDEYRLMYENHSDEDLMRYLNITQPADLTREKEKYKKGLSTHNKTFLVFQILEKQNEKIIGACGYHTWYLDHARAEIGYALTDETAKAKGIMSEAMGAILKYGFEEMKLNRIEAFVGTGNVPSLKLMEKFGFVKEGQLRKHYFKNGNAEDSVVFGLLKEEARL